MSRLIRKPALRLGPLLAGCVLAGPALSQLIVDEASDPQEAAAQLSGTHGGIRIDVDRPKPAYTLAQRAPRVQRLPPFQPLVDAAAPGS